MIKAKKLFLTLFASVLCSFAFADIPENLSFDLSIDFAYYPQSDAIINNEKTHFSPLTGAYSGLEGRVTGSANYKIDTPLGTNWLVSDANIVLSGQLEITPVSVRPIISATFTPLPFLVFSAGTSAGTGWNLAGLKGMAKYNFVTDTYDDLTPFKYFFTKWYAEGTFQFDTGAVIPGDWTHVVMQYTYQIYNESLSGCNTNDIWEWQVSGNKANGLQNYQCGILAYQMPLVLYRAGVMYESDGHIKSSDYKNAEYKGDFKSISISPLLQFKFNESNTLACLFGFSSRRSYKEPVTKETETTNSFCTREWYFNRFALSYSKSF